MFGEEISEMDSNKRDEIINPEHYATIRKHCGDSVLSNIEQTKEESEEQEEEQNIQQMEEGAIDLAGETKIQRPDEEHADL